MRREMLALEPNAVFLDNQTMEAQVAANLLPARLAAQTLGLVGIVATLLAAVGLYGVIAYAVGRRTREIGIRMALGAAPRDVLRMVMGQGLGIVAAGLGVGLALSWVAARAIASALYGVGAADPAAWTQRDRRHGRVRRARELPPGTARRARESVRGLAVVVGHGFLFFEPRITRITRI